MTGKMSNNFGFEVRKSGQSLIFVDSRGKEYVTTPDLIDHDMKKVHDENKIGDLQKEIESLREENKSIRKENHDLDTARENEGLRSESLQKEIESLRKENEELIAARKNEEIKNDFLQRDVEILRKENDDLKARKIEVPVPTKDWQVALLGEYLTAMKKDDV
jgi:chromosome segregation ATPase